MRKLTTAPESSVDGAALPLSSSHSRRRAKNMDDPPLLEYRKTHCWDPRYSNESGDKHCGQAAGTKQSSSPERQKAIKHYNYIIKKETKRQLPKNVQHKLCHGFLKERGKTQPLIIILEEQWKNNRNR